jgi:hypothetical protein
MAGPLPRKRSLFEKSDAKTFVYAIQLKSRINGFLSPPAPPPVMPAKAGIHDFSVSVTKALVPGAARKSWMPAFAGMTRFFGGHRHTFAPLAAQLRAPFIFGFSIARGIASFSSEKEVLQTLR